MSILITGGTGHVGSNIARKLVEQGRDVVLYDAAPPAPGSVLTDVLNRVGIEIGNVGDLANILHVIKARNIEGIIHCAAMAGRLVSDERPIEAITVNILGSANMLEAARIANLRRVILLSSSSVMGAPDDLVTPRKEEDVILPLLGLYRISKLTCEQLAYTYKQLFKVDTLAVRPRSVVGPGSRKIGTKTFKSPMPLSEVVEAAAVGQPLHYEKGGDTAFDFIYAKDIAKGIIQAYDCESPRYHVYNLSFGQNRTMYQVCDVLKQLFPKLTIEIGPGLWPGSAEKGEQSLGEKIIQRPPQDITRARQDFGFNPEWDLDRLIPDWIRWIKEGKY